MAAALGAPEAPDQTAPEVEPRASVPAAPAWGASHDWEDTHRMEEDEEARLLDQAGSTRVVEASRKMFHSYLEKYGQGPSATSCLSLPHRSIFLLPMMPTWSTIFMLVHYVTVALDMVYIGFIFPFNFAWNESLDRNGLLWLELAVCLCFAVDALINFQVPFILQYKTDKLLVHDGRHVAWLYITRRSGVIDIVSSFSFLVTTCHLIASAGSQGGDEWWYIKIFKLLRFHRIFNIMGGIMFGQWVYGYLGNSWAYKTFSLMTMYTLGLAYSAAVVVHELACIWWTIGTRGDLGPSWTSKAGGVGDLYVQSTWAQYTATVYYIMTTVTAVGYGDIIPRNTFEQCWAMATMAVGVLFFAFLIGSVIHHIMTDSDAAVRASRFKDKSQLWEGFATINCVSSTAKENALRHYATSWLVHNEEAELWSIVGDLGPRLRAQLLADLAGPYLRALEPFQGMSDAVLLQLAGAMEPLALAPEAELCKHGDAADCVWLLREGNVALRRSGKQVGRTVWAPGLLGAAALRQLTASPSSKPNASAVQPYTIRTLRNSVALRLPLSSLRYLLHTMPHGDALQLLTALTAVTSSVQSWGQDRHTVVQSHCVEAKGVSVTRLLLPSERGPARAAEGGKQTAVEVQLATLRSDRELLSSAHSAAAPAAGGAA